jgi:hypothetical protein
MSPSSLLLGYKSQVVPKRFAQDPTCFRCGEGPETMGHIAECPALAVARSGKPAECFDVSPDSELWKGGKKGKTLMKCFVSFVMRYKVNFPTRMEMFPFTRVADLAS